MTGVTPDTLMESFGDLEDPRQAQGKRLKAAQDTDYLSQVLDAQNAIALVCEGIVKVAWNCLVVQVSGKVARNHARAEGGERELPSKPRFRDTGKSSFCGSFVYDRIVPQEYFLVALEKLYDWSDMSRLLLQAYQGQGLRGRPPYDPVQMFKILFVCYLFGASERQVEDLVNYHLLVKCFVGLAVNERAPDHSPLTVFRNRHLETGQWEHLRPCFDQVIKQAVAQGVEPGDLHAGQHAYPG